MTYSFLRYFFIAMPIKLFYFSSVEAVHGRNGRVHRASSQVVTGNEMETGERPEVGYHSGAVTETPFIDVMLVLCSSIPGLKILRFVLAVFFAFVSYTLVICS